MNLVKTKKDLFSACVLNVVNDDIRKERFSSCCVHFGRKFIASKLIF